jgi:pumilio RNA-binding family
MNNNAKYSVPTCSPVVLGSQVSGAQQGNVDEQDFEEEAPLREDTMKLHEHLIAVHVECYCAANDLDMTTSAGLLEQAIQGMKQIHYAPDALEANYGDNPADADTTTIVIRRPRASSVSPQVQNHVHRDWQQIMTAPVMNTMISLRDIEGQVAEYWYAPLVTL